MTNSCASASSIVQPCSQRGRRWRKPNVEQYARTSRPPQGLYDPGHEHDACGVGFVVDIKGGARTRSCARRSRSSSTSCTAARAAARPNTGDGAGILVQIPDRFLRRECARSASPCPPAGDYGAGLVFLPRDAEQRDKVRALLHTIVDGGRAAAARLARRAHRRPSARRERASRSSRTSCRSSSAAAPAVRDQRALRAQALRDPQALRERGRRARHSGEASSPTCRASRRTRSSTRACSARTRSRRCSPTSPIPTSSRRWPSSTSGSAPTPSRRGRSRIRTATSPTTARSTRCAATSTGCRRARRCAGRRCCGDDLDEGAAGHARRAVGLRHVRQRARVPGDERPVAAPRHPHDDPRAVAEPRVDEPGAARLLRVPLLADGALGRPRVDRLHRRHRDRRRAGPQWAPALALLRHQGRHGRHGLRGRRARHSRRERSS